MKYNKNYCFSGSTEDSYNSNNIFYSDGYCESEGSIVPSSDKDYQNETASSFADISKVVCKCNFINGDTLMELAPKKTNNKRNDILESYQKDQSKNSGTIPQNYDFFKITEDLHSGDKKRRESAQVKTLDALEGIIMSIIKNNYYTYAPKHFEDMKSSAQLGIIKAMDDYVPEKGAASTFYYRHIIHEIQKYIDEFVNKTSTHYASNMRKIKKAINEFNNQDVSYTTTDIALFTKMTMETVEQSMSIINYTDNIYFDGCTEGYINKNSSFRREVNPEYAVEENQANEAIYKALNDCLTIDERAVVMMAIGFGDANPSSYKEISSTLGIPIDKVRKIYNEALRKLKSSRILRCMFYDQFEQEEAILQSSDLTFFDFDIPLNENELIAQSIEIDF